MKQQSTVMGHLLCSTTYSGRSAAVSRQGIQSHRLPEQSFRKRRRRFIAAAASEQVGTHRGAQILSWASWTGLQMQGYLKPILKEGTSSSVGAPLMVEIAPSCHVSRRRSVDDPAAGRHYSHGGISALASHRDFLEHCACAARLQLSCHANATGSTAHPGHVAVSGTKALRGPLHSDAGTSALASVGLDGDCPSYVRSIATDERLVEFGAIIEEKSAQRVAEELKLPVWGARNSLFGATDNDHSAWDCIMEETTQGLKYKAWRRLLRNNLFVYRTSVTFEGISPRDLRPFHLDDGARELWDEGAISIDRLSPDGLGHARKHTEWCIHRYVSKFPRPMASREYVYARRVWHRPSDGGCYAISLSCKFPIGDAGPNVVSVKEYASACVIRAAEGGSEMLTVYFEDSNVRAGLAKMAVPKALWPYAQKYNAALRQFVEARKDAEMFDSVLEENASDDGLEVVYAGLSNKRKSRRFFLFRKPGNTKWARRVVVAAAMKMLHIILVESK